MVAALFDSKAPAAITEMILRLRQETEKVRQARIERIDRLYANQDDAKAELIPYASERARPDEGGYIQRQKRLAISNYAARIADALIAGVYGDEIKLSIDNNPKSAANKALEAILAWNNWPQRQRMIGYGQVVQGDAWIGVRFVDEKDTDRTIGLPVLHTCNVYPIYHPDNPAHLIQAIERREEEPLYGDDKRARSMFWVWDREWFRVVDENGQDVEITINGQIVHGQQGHGYGVIPLVRVPGRVVVGADYGLSYIEDAVDLQVQILNWMSELGELTLAQVHSLLVTMGGIGDRRQAQIKIGPDAHLALATDGDAKYIQPDADHEQLRENIRLTQEMLADTTAVPLSTIRGGATATSGYQAELEMAPTARVTKSIATDAVSGLESLLRVIVAVGNYHGIPGLNLDAKTITPSVEITASLLPRDEETERARHATEVSEGHRTRKDYVRRWVKPDADEAELDAYMLELKSEQEEKQAALAAEFDAKFRQPGNELKPGDKEPEEDDAKEGGK